MGRKHMESARDRAVKPPLDSWIAESFRVTTFHDFEEKLDHDSLWLELIGSPADEKISKPREGSTRLRAQVDDFQIRMDFTPGKLNFYHDSLSELSPLPNDINFLGTMPQAASRFLTDAEKLVNLPSYPRIIRVALGMVLRLRANDRGEAYRRLDALIPEVDLDSSASSEFFYRINWPCNARIGDETLVINRLSTWSAITEMRMWGLIGEEASKKTETIFCKLETDVNTDLKHKGDFDAESLKVLYNISARIPTEGTQYAT